MNKPSQRAVIIFVGVAVIYLLAVLLTQKQTKQPFFSAAPASLTLHTLGEDTNYLKMDHAHHWQAFSVSNGTSKTLFCTVSGVEYRSNDVWYSAGSWTSNNLSATSLRTRHETSGEIPPGTTDVFYATVSTTRVPWRLRVGCFESGSGDAINASISNMKAAIQGKPPSKVKSWSGARYEIISEPIDPQ